jgi:hypothetical protein
MCNTYTWQRQSQFIKDKPILLSERMLHKNYEYKCLVAKKKLSLWASRGLAPRWTDWRQTASCNVTLTLEWVSEWVRGRNCSPVEWEWPVIVRYLLVSKRVKVWKEQKYSNRSWWVLKPGTIVLARARSNLWTGLEPVSREGRELL